MRLLLDSQAFVLMVRDPEAVPLPAREAIEDSSNRVFLSIASAVELRTKINLGKRKIVRPLREAVERELRVGTFELLPISLDHVDELSRLPDHHRDPFDRLLVAQALSEGMTIVTADRSIARYAAPVLWA
jgi:PIN domain nuclease of toxin-antitoxin system